MTLSDDQFRERIEARKAKMESDTVFGLPIGRSERPKPIPGSGGQNPDFQQYRQQGDEGRRFSQTGGMLHIDGRPIPAKPRGDGSYEVHHESGAYHIISPQWDETGEAAVANVTSFSAARVGKGVPGSSSDGQLGVSDTLRTIHDHEQGARRRAAKRGL